MSKKTSKEQDTKPVQIRASIHKKLKDFCDAKGYKIGFFTEFAIMKYIAGQENKP